MLSVLAASKPHGRLAEIGTAFGEGAKAIAQSMGPTATFVTVEPDPERFAHSRGVLEGTGAEVLNADWQDVLPERGPFDLIFFDGGSPAETLHLAIELLAPGGVLIKDDLTPSAPIASDPVRRAMLEDPRLIGVEVVARSDMAIIIATRRS